MGLSKNNLNPNLIIIRKIKYPPHISMYRHFTIVGGGANHIKLYLNGNQIRSQ
jgi:hypothetical protein